MKLKKLPRLFAFNDLSGFGKCALSITIPVVSACGAEVCPIPTAILSTNTKFSGYQLLDFTTQAVPFLAHWEALGIRADGLYIGFFSSCEQVDIALGIIERFKPRIVVLDPIMGDHGKLYKTFDDQLCKKIKELVPKSDIITPNLTEACILADKPYEPAGNSENYILSLLDGLKAIGAKKVVLKGIERADRIYNYCLGKGIEFKHDTELLPYKMFGTGDLFASVLTGKLLMGHSLHSSIVAASEFVYRVMRESRQYEGYEERGLCFEPYLGRLLD